MNVGKFSILIIFVFLACVRPKDQERLPSIVATVDDSPIMVENLKLHLQLEKFDSGIEDSDTDAFLTFKQNVLGKLIDRQVMINWGTRNGIQLTNEDLALGLDKLKKGYSDKEFELMLKDKGLTFVQWTEVAKESILVQKVIEFALKDQIKVTAKEVETYYKANKEDYKIEERVHVKQIVTDTQEKADEIMNKLKKGENFSELAITYSIAPDRANGGDLGFVSRGTFPIPFDDICFKMKPGEVSSVIKTDYGYHIFKLIEIKPPGYLTISEVLPDIQSQLEHEKLVTSFEPWFKELRLKSIVSINQKILEDIEL